MMWIMQILTLMTMMMKMTIDQTNDVGDKEGKPADDEDPHHRSQSLRSFCLFWNPFHYDYDHYDHEYDDYDGQFLF